MCASFCEKVQNYSSPSHDENKGRLLGVEAVLQNGIWFKVKEEAKRHPEEYMKYFEDCLFASDAEIGP
jgi:hypothetical protein